MSSPMWNSLLHEYDLCPKIMILIGMKGYEIILTNWHIMFDLKDCKILKGFRM